MRAQGHLECSRLLEAAGGEVGSRCKGTDQEKHVRAHLPPRR